MTELLLFGSTFVTVFALGFQSLNVNQGRYLAAFMTSFVIGGASIALYKVLPDASLLQCAAYLLGGATGIVASMWTHKRTVGRKVIDVTNLDSIAGRAVSGSQPFRQAGQHPPKPPPRQP